MIAQLWQEDIAHQAQAKLANSSLLASKGYINGQWVDATDNETFDIINPATGLKIAQAPNMPRSQVAEAIKAAKTAFPAWAKLTAYQRQRYLRDLHKAMLDNAEDLAIILCAENGKPMVEAKGEIAYGASFLSWFAEESIRRVTSRPDAQS